MAFGYTLQRFIMDRSTIAAVATPVGRGGIGIIRMSGNESLAVAAKIFRPGRLHAKDPDLEARHPSFESIRSHQMIYGHIVDPSESSVVDEVMLVFMKAPRSYTREDVVEIHSHSGPAILHEILSLILGLGPRLAEPGEFTRRAFLNGRIDLSQAEAVIDVINARTATSLGVASLQLQGEIRSSVEDWRSVLKSLIATMEAEIEFGDETGTVFESAGVSTAIKQSLIGPLKQSIDTYTSGHILRDGLQVVVIGRPNVGKSSLLNRLIKKERAIVTAHPGTTRDTIEESLSIRGIPTIITDTAGLHQAVEPAEVLGIRKTHEYIDHADLILFMIAADEGILSEDLEIYAQLEARPVILVVNKIDLVQNNDGLAQDGRFKDLPAVAISAKYNHGVDTLKDEIVAFVMQDSSVMAADRAIPKLRHKQIFESCQALLDRATTQLDQGTAVDLAIIDLQKAYDLLGEVLGENTGEDILDEIFGRFCIGK